MFKIIEMTPARLVLVFRPFLLIGLLGAFGLVPLMIALSGAAPASVALPLLAVGVLPGLLALRFIPFRRLVFDREAGTLTRHEWRLGSTRANAMPLGDVEAAVIEKRPNAKGQMLHRLALRLYDQTIALDAIWASMKIDREAAAINAWLSGPDLGPKPGAGTGPRGEAPDGAPDGPGSDDDAPA